jgi:hypothetical protein
MELNDSGRSDGRPQSTYRVRVEIGGLYLPPQLERTLQGKSHLCIPFLGIAQPQSQFPHSCVSEQFIYSQDQSTYFPAAEYADRTWKDKKISHRYVSEGTGRENIIILFWK